MSSNYIGITCLTCGYLPACESLVVVNKLGGVECVRLFLSHVSKFYSINIIILKKWYSFGRTGRTGFYGPAFLLQQSHIQNEGLALDFS